MGRKRKILSVAVGATSEIHAFRDAAGHDPESYWLDLLHDPRGRVQRRAAYVTE